MYKVLLRSLAFAVLYKVTSSYRPRRDVPMEDSCRDTGCCCWGWKFIGKCRLSSDYAVESCPKTCGFCPKPTSAPPPTASLGSVFTPTTTSTTTAVSSSTVAPTASFQNAPCDTPKLPVSDDRFFDQRLTGDVVRQEGAISEIQCEDYCLRAPTCVAYNFHYEGSHESGRKDCELLRKIEGISSVIGVSFRIFDRSKARKIFLGHCDD